MAVNVNSLEGNEIADDYVRTASQTEGGKWAQTWAVFKGSFWKLVLINVIMLICCAPALGILIYRNFYISTVIAPNYPFNGNTGIGYPAYPGTDGLAESLFLKADLVFYAILIGAGLIAAIGLSGGAYAIKKLLNTQGGFSFKGFFHGIKVGYFKTALPLTLFLVFFFACVIIGDWKDLVIAQGGSKGGPITAYVFIIIATVLVGIYCAWLFAVGLSYRLKFSKLIKNSFALLAASPLQTVFIAGFALIPVWVFMLSTFLISTANTLFFILASVLLLLLVLFGVSFILLVWMSFTQWVFDLYVTPKIQTVEDRKKEIESEEDEGKRIARELLAAGRSELLVKPILPVAEGIAVAPLGQTFTRADIERVASSRQKLENDVADYENKHKNDPVYAEYSKLFADREKALQPQGKKGKKKKVSSANLLK